MAIVTSDADAAAFRGAQVLAVTSSIVATAFRFLALRYAATTVGSASFFGLRLAGLGAAASFAVGIPVLFLPDSLGMKILGDVWGPAFVLVPYILLQKAMTAATLGYIAVARSRLPLFQIGGLRSAISVASASIAAAIAWSNGPSSAIVTLAAGSVIMCLVLHGRLIRVATEGAIA
jgi:hypothetical protein